MRRGAPCATTGSRAITRPWLRSGPGLRQQAVAALFAPDQAGGWRADVLVTAAGGRQTALEAQLSSTPVDDVLARTHRYQDDEVGVVWFTHRDARWLDHVPAARLYRPAAPDGPWNRLHPIVSRFSVVACAEVCDPSPFWHGPVHAGWDHGEERGLTEFIADVLNGRLVPRTLTTALGTRYHGWAAPEDVKAADDHTASTQTMPPAPA